MTFSALLLAGGESRRMGRDKATMDFEGQPLWKRQLELLQALDPEKIFVSARTPPSWLPDEVGLLLDDPPSRGPISGLTKALAAIGTTHLIVLAADMPFMVANELRYLQKLATEGRGVVPIIEERAEPLAAIYPAPAAEDFQCALEGPDFSLQSIVRKLAAAGKVTLCRVPEKRANLYRSVNEPGDIKEGRFPNRPFSDGPAAAG
jgi:molybdopterin-guanine dinucleotide biosynthesis protein A